MKLRTFQSLVLAMLVIASAGCAHTQSSDAGKLSSTEPCSPSLRQPLVFYDDAAGAPSEKTAVFSELELTQAVETMAAQTSKAIWFIRVGPFFSSDVTVYLAPEKATARIREGRAYAVRVFGEPTPPRLLGQYIQISRSDQPFTKELTLPSPGDLPFFRSRASDSDSKKDSLIPARELVRILDLVRQASNYRDWRKPEQRAMFAKMAAGPSRAAKIAKGIQEMPILEITRKGDEIRVTFGFLYGPLVGHGVYATVERTLWGYRIKRCGEWVS